MNIEHVEAYIAMLRTRLAFDEAKLKEAFEGLPKEPTGFFARRAWGKGMERAASMQEAAVDSLKHYSVCLDVLTAKVIYCKAAHISILNLDLKSSPHDWTSDFYIWAAVNCK